MTDCFNVSIVAAMSANNVIGNNNKMLWRLPNDMRRFVYLTTGKNVVMGRKTHESIGKVLPNRNNIIITRNTDYTSDHEGEISISNIAGVLALSRIEPVVVIGGEEIYREFIPYASRLYLTKINAHYEGDAFFPEINWYEWGISKSQRYAADKDHLHDYEFFSFWRTIKHGA